MLTPEQDKMWTALQATDTLAHLKWLLSEYQLTHTPDPQSAEILDQVKKNNK